MVVTWDQLQWDAEFGSRSTLVATIDTPLGQIKLRYDPPRKWEGTGRKYMLKPWIMFENIESMGAVHVAHDMTEAACFLVAIQQGEPVTWNRGVAGHMLIGRPA